MNSIVVIGPKEWCIEHQERLSNNKITSMQYSPESRLFSNCNDNFKKMKLPFWMLVYVPKDYFGIKGSGKIEYACRVIEYSASKTRTKSPWDTFTLSTHYHHKHLDGKYEFWFKVDLITQVDIPYQSILFHKKSGQNVTHQRLDQFVTALRGKIGFCSWRQSTKDKIPATSAEDKIARICWNTNLWQKPSGKEGKTKNNKAYELITGYGHEEWLLDTEKIIDGYHYGFLQAINSFRDKYIGKKFNISLYSIDSSTSDRWWIGQIKDVHVVSAEESRHVRQIYKDNKWLNEMEDQLAHVGANVEDFRNTPPDIFCNVKYSLNNLELLNPPRRFSDGDPAVTSDYYNLKNKKLDPKLEVPKFTFIAGHNNGKHTSTSSYGAKTTIKDLMHNRIQANIYKYLVKLYGKDNVGTEQNTGFGSRVDIVVKNTNGDFTFYELKTSNSLITCIRDAISQLLEYAYYPSNDNASRLIIVSQNTIDVAGCQYLAKLRKSFKLPIYYQRYDLITQKLEEQLY